MIVVIYYRVINQKNTCLILRLDAYLSRLETIIDPGAQNLSISESRFLWIARTIVIQYSMIKSVTDPESLNTQISRFDDAVPVKVDYAPNDSINENLVSATMFYVASDGLVGTIQYNSLYKDLSTVFSSKHH
ncbi:MAG TPA: hypothetical protein VJ044_03805 [Candidatus Hodarchaeales archaeon]|nr:hypothetical protein [Candidatus Hodarchaeales archaeon]